MPLVALWLIGLAAASLGAAQIDHMVRAHQYGELSPICRVSTTRQVVALSFDDGPDPSYTPEVVSLLRRYQDRATFFLVGQEAKTYPKIVRLERSAGMEIGNHTWSHPDLPDLSLQRVTSEIARTQHLLTEDGNQVDLVRSPYGEITPAELSTIEHMGLTTVHWSLALDHYVGGLSMSPSEAAAALARDARPGDIILAHDARLLPGDGGGGGARQTAMQALRLLLPALQRRGFAVIPVGELLREGSVVRDTPRPWFWESGFTCPR